MSRPLPTRWRGSDTWSPFSDHHVEVEQLAPVVLAEFPGRSAGCCGEEVDDLNAELIACRSIHTFAQAPQLIREVRAVDETLQ